MKRLLLVMAVALSLSVLVVAQPDDRPAEPASAFLSTPRAFDLLVAQLRDDNVRWNAPRAMDELRRAGPSAFPALDSALVSNDWQQHQLAAHVLRRNPEYVPSQQLLAVTVEGLRSDDLPSKSEKGQRETYTPVYNAGEGTRYLLDHAERAAPSLVRALNSDDPQQRFLAAYVLGCGGVGPAVDRAAPVLIEHLRDNEVEGDAIMAAAALYRFGTCVTPFLLERLPANDMQQDQLIRLILLDMYDPPLTAKALRERHAMNTITRSCLDPVYQSNPRRFRMPHGF
jgi:HEAT repeat protein